MTVQKLVNGDLLSRLLEGSYEMVLGRVDDAVSAHRDLFGGRDGVDVRAIGTFPGHVVVVNEDGDFFRAAWSVTESGEVEIGDVQRIDVPVKEARELCREARESSARAVDAILSGDAKAAAEIESLYRLVGSGVRLTAEAVEESTACSCETPSWLVALHDNEKAIRTFVGAEIKRDLQRPRFESIDQTPVEDRDKFRSVVAGSLQRLRENLRDMQSGIALALAVNESYTFKGAHQENPDMAVGEFVTFVRDYSRDLGEALGSVEDALAVCEDGTLTSLARVHDLVAAKVEDLGLAAAFVARLARRFEEPKAA